MLGVSFAKGVGCWGRSLVGLAVVPSLTACATVIVAPEPPVRPQPVFVLDHGRHTSLVLPRPGGLVRYAYGDWRWYAEVDTGPVEATSAVLWPTSAGLGRRLLEGPATEWGVRRAIRVDIQHLYRLRIEADAASALRARLDSLFEANRAKLKYNRAYDLEFVPHPDPYAAWHNSNHVTADWLRQLGCTIRGSAFWADWKVVESHRESRSGYPRLFFSMARPPGARSSGPGEPSLLHRASQLGFRQREPGVPGKGG